MATIEADATTLGASRRDRGAAVLRSCAEEEAAEVLKVRGYVDHVRQEYYVDRPMDRDGIFGNEVLASREERLQVDDIEDEHGDRHWTGPADRAAIVDAPFSFPALASTMVRLVAAMRCIASTSGGSPTSWALSTTTAPTCRPRL